MRIIYLLFTVLLFTFSCSSPLDTPYNKETLDKDAAAMLENGDLSEEDGKILMGWIVAAAMEGKSLDGKTYQQIIDEAKDYQKQQEELAEKTRLEDEAKRQKLGAALTVALYDKGFKQYNYQDYIVYSFAFENKSEKDIRAFKGVVSFQDLFDTEISSLSLTIDDTIKAGETFKGDYTSNYNQFRDSDIKLKNKELKDLKVVWTPEKIIFTDGSTLE